MIVPSVMPYMTSCEPSTVPEFEWRQKEEGDDEAEARIPEPEQRDQADARADQQAVEGGGHEFPQDRAAG